MDAAPDDHPTKPAPDEELAGAVAPYRPPVKVSSSRPAQVSTRLDPGGAAKSDVPRKKGTSKGRVLEQSLHRFGPFIIVRTLGRGGMGEVFVARTPWDD